MKKLKVIAGVLALSACGGGGGGGVAFTWPAVNKTTNPIAPIPGVGPGGVLRTYAAAGEVATNASGAAATTDDIIALVSSFKEVTAAILTTELGYANRNNPIQAEGNLFIDGATAASNTEGIVFDLWSEGGAFVRFNSGSEPTFILYDSTQASGGSQILITGGLEYARLTGSSALAGDITYNGVVRYTIAPPSGASRDHMLFTMKVNFTDNDFEFRVPAGSSGTPAADPRLEVDGTLDIVTGRLTATSTKDGLIWYGQLHGDDAMHTTGQFYGTGTSLLRGGFIGTR